MNSVELFGRLVRDPDVRYTGEGMCVCSFTLAIQRNKDKTDFPQVKVFGQQAENCEKYLKKGRMVAVSGEIQTGSYEGKNGKVYTQDIVAKHVDFGERQEPKQEQRQAEPKQMDFAAIDDDVPF